MYSFLVYFNWGLISNEDEAASTQNVAIKRKYLKK